MRYIRGILLLVVCAGVLVSVGPAQATTLTFDYKYQNRKPIDPNYGDNVAAVEQNGFTYGGEAGFTPHIAVDYGPSGANPSLLANGYGDLLDVLYNNSNSSSLEITMIAESPVSIWTARSSGMRSF